MNDQNIGRFGHVEVVRVEAVPHGLPSRTP
jgi:hypothetical protein